MEETHPKQVLVLANTIQVPPAERQRPKILVNHAEQRLGRAEAQVHVADVLVLGVVRRLHVVPHVAVARAAKRLDSEDIALLHLGAVVALDDGYGLRAVDAVGQDVVARQVADALDGVGLPVDLDLEALHRLLDDAANLPHAGVDARLADTCVGRLLDGLEQVVVLVVERHGEGRVDNLPVDVHTEIHLHHVLLAQDHLIPGVGGVMGGAVVQTQATGESHTADERITLSQAVVARERPDAVLDALGDLRQRLPRLDRLLRILPNLAMDLCGLAVVGQEVAVQVVQVALLLARGPVAVLLPVLDLLAGRVVLVGEQEADLDGGGVRLARRRGLLLLLGLSLLFLLGGARRARGSAVLLLGVVYVLVVVGVASLAVHLGGCVIH